MQHQLINHRVGAELIVAVVLGLVFVRMTSWCDPDPPIPTAAYFGLVIIGLVFGVFGRSPVLLIGPVTGSASILGGLEIISYGWRGFGFEMVMFTMMTAIVLVAAATGRALKRYHQRKMNRVA
jgi:hypothetical protein